MLVIGSIITFSCAPSDEEKRNTLQGSWKLEEVIGESTFKRDYLTSFMESARNHYLDFAGDSVTSTEHPCYIIDKGIAHISGDSIHFTFDDFEQSNHFTVNDTSLILTRYEKGRSNQYIYKKQINGLSPFVWKMGEGRNSVWPEGYTISDGCFCGYKWIYTGKYETINNGVLRDTIFAMPDTLNLAESGEHWEDGKSQFILDHYCWTYWDGEQFYECRIYQYDGTYLKLIPYQMWEKDLSNKAFIYKRVR